MFTRRPLLLLILAGLAGCSDAAEEGSFSSPAGFSDEQTRRALLNPGAFIRDENRKITTSTVQTRLAVRKGKGLAVDAISGDPGDDFRLEAVFGGSYAEGMTVATSRHPKASLRVVPRLAQSAPGRVRGDGAMVAFEGAYRNVTSVFSGRQTKVEEFLSIPSEADIPELSYDLIPGPEFGHIIERDGVLWAFSRENRGLFTIAPPVADDAAGKRVTGSWRLERAGEGYTLTASIELRGLRFPVLLDPTFEVPRWWLNGSPSAPSARAGAVGAYDAGEQCAVLFGGATTSFDLLDDTFARCSSDRQWSGALSTSGTPEGRAYAGMAHVGGVGVALFGGFGAGGALDDLYTLALSCPSGSSSCTGAWTAVTRSGTWPAARYMHGAASDGSSLIIWGGVSAAGLPLTDTWSWNGSEWTQICDDCFVSPRGLYGLAAASTVSAGGARTIYSVGGYNDVASANGEFTNNVHRFTGSGWVDMSASSSSVPLNDGAQLFAPPVRHMHWAAGTDGGNLLIGSGLKVSASGVETFYSDTWLWSSDGSSWLRTPNPTASVGDVGPGARESAVAIFDEVNRDMVLFGGLDASNSAQQNSLVYKGEAHVLAVTESCQDADLDGLCDGNDISLDAVLNGVGAGDCGSFEIAFLKMNTTTLQWEEEALVAPSFGVDCRATRVYDALDVNVYGDLGVRVRDLRLHDSSRGVCGDSAGEAASDGQPGCLPSGAYFEGSATCGGLVDPSIPGLETVDCTLY